MTVEATQDATTVAHDAPTAFFDRFPTLAENATYRAWIDELARRFPSSAIEFPFDIAPAVFRAYERGEIGALTIRLRASSEAPRKYLGASGLGEPCARKAWAQWRGLNSWEGRMLRLFRSGDIYEARMDAELRAIGFTLGGDQSRFEALDGRVAGHTDGFATIAELPLALLEEKSSNHSRFGKLRNLIRDEGPAGLEKWSPKYWGQIHLYMRAFGVDVCLYVVSDKDTDDIFAFLVARDDAVVASLGERAVEILDADGPPSRGYSRARTPECTRFCDFADWCWYGADLPRACGTCVHWRNGACSLGRPLELCGDYRAVPYSADAVSEWETL